MDRWTGDLVAWWPGGLVDRWTGGQVAWWSGGQVVWWTGGLVARWGSQVSCRDCQTGGVYISPQNPEDLEWETFQKEIAAEVRPGLLKP